MSLKELTADQKKQMVVLEFLERHALIQFMAAGTESLANGSRVGMDMALSYREGQFVGIREAIRDMKGVSDGYKHNLPEYNLRQALNVVFEMAKESKNDPNALQARNIEYDILKPLFESVDGGWKLDSFDSVLED